MTHGGDILQELGTVFEVTTKVTCFAFQYELARIIPV